MADPLDESLKKLQELQNRPDGMTHKEWNTIKKGLKELQRRKEAPFDPKKHKAETTFDLAKMFIRYYFIAVLVVLLYVPLYNWFEMKYLGKGKADSISVKDSFTMISTAITPLLAFVLGHYFKGKD